MVSGGERLSVCDRLRWQSRTAADTPPPARRAGIAGTVAESIGRELITLTFYPDTMIGDRNRGLSPVSCPRFPRFPAISRSLNSRKEGKLDASFAKQNDHSTISGKLLMNISRLLLQDLWVSIFFIFL